MTRSGAGAGVYLALLGAQLGFGLFPVLGKVALARIPPLPFAALRVAAAAVLLEAARRAYRAPVLPRAEIPAVFLYSLLGVSINQILFVEGLSLSTAVNATLLMTTIPVFTLGIAIALKRESVSLRRVAGVALALAGALLILRAERFDWRSGHFRGNVLLLINALSYSLYLVLSRPLLARRSALSFTAAVFLLGALPILAYAAGPVSRFSFREVDLTAWLCLAAVVLLPTFLSYLLNAWALQRLEASRVALFVYVQPLVAAALAVALLGERLRLRDVAAAALIGAGIAVTKAPPTRRPPA